MFNPMYNITDIPIDLMEHLGLPSEFVAEVFILLICVAIFSVPFVWKGYTTMAIVTAFLSVVFCTSMGWVDAWIIMTLVMLISSMFAFGFFKKAIQDSG